MGAVIADSEPGGGRSKSVGTFLKSGNAGSVAVWSGDVGSHPEDGAGPGYLPEQGHKTAHWEATKYTGGWELGLPAIGGGNGGSRFRGDQ